MDSLQTEKKQMVMVPMSIHKGVKQDLPGKIELPREKGLSWGPGKDSAVLLPQSPDSRILH